MFLGLDSSTQSLSALLLDPETGALVGEESISFGAELPHYGSPSGFLPGGRDGTVHADPRMWLEALDRLFDQLAARHDLRRVQALACSGQQHGSVYLNPSFPTRLGALRPEQSLVEQLAPCLSRGTSPIWMDTSTRRECDEIAAAVGGPEIVCQRSGSVAIERFTGPQIRRFWKSDPAAYQSTSTIHLVSSFIGSVLAGRSIEIDFGDGAGMNLLNLAELDWDADLLEATAPDLAARLPSVRPSASIAGTVAAYFQRRYGFAEDCQVVLSTGDNPSSLIGMGATQPGLCVISLGTSDTFFAAMSEPRTDPQGYGHVFGNPAGGFMSLICFRNGSLARERLRDELGLDWSDFDAEGLRKTPAGNDGCRMLPFYEPEITPRHDFAGPVRDFPATAPPEVQVRALLEGQFLNMRLHARWIGEAPQLIRMTGGASQNEGIAALVADVFQAPVERFSVSNGAALGAAIRAAHACGHDLAALTQTFCRPAPDSRIEPDAALAPVYDDQLDAFEALLERTLGSHSNPPATPD
jgi:xylulokinase